MYIVVKMDEMRLSGECSSKKMDRILGDVYSSKMDGMRLSGECSSKNGWKIKWWI